MKKNKLLKIIIFIILLFSILQLGKVNFFFYSNKFNKENYNKIIKIIENNNLKGFLYMSKFKPLYGESFFPLKKNYDGNLGQCQFTNGCYDQNDNLINILNKNNIFFIRSEDNYIKVIPNTFPFQEYLFFYYSPGFFKGKQEETSFDGNEYRVIRKIYDDNWGLIDGCYGCSIFP